MGVLVKKFCIRILNTEVLISRVCIGALIFFNYLNTERRQMYLTAFC